MTIRHVAIVGHGLIGGSIALALRERRAEVQITTLDRDDALVACRGADLIVLSAPVRANLENLRALRGVLPGRTLITDTGSTKTSILAEAAGLRFIGGHPVAGLAATGREAARPDLFERRRWILTPPDTAVREDITCLAEFVESMGAIPTSMNAADHDRLFAFVSHLPQLTISALMHAVGQAVGRDGLAFAGPGLHDSTRLAESPPDIWRDIVADNREHVTAAIDALIAVLQTLRNDVSGEELAEIFDGARRARAALDRH